MPCTMRKPKSFTWKATKPTSPMLPSRGKQGQPQQRYGQGVPLPTAAHVPEAPNMASLPRLRAHKAALELAHTALATEHTNVKAKAAKAASDVDALVNAILDLEIEKEANETLALQQELWRRVDSLEGVFQMRKEPKLEALTDRVKQGLRRDKYLISEQPQLIEQHHWDAHMDKLRSEAETQWREFAVALTKDADTERTTHVYS